MAITAAPLLSKIMNARIAGHAGTGRQLTLVMVNTSMFRHPKYYKELRKRNKAAQVNAHSVSISDQAISLRESETSAGERAPGQGLKQQAIEESVPHNDIEEAQASSSKQQASSSKLLKQ